MASNPSKERRHTERQLVGGIHTNAPPHRLGDGVSPDLENVLFPDGAAQRRGGFNLLAKQHARGSCLRNSGRTYNAREIFNAASGPDSANVPYLTVAGLGVAPHKAVYNRISDSWSIEFFFRAENLIPKAGNRGAEFVGTDPGLRIRPILSKGPLKKSEETNAAYGYGLINGTSLADTGNGPNWIAPDNQSGWGVVSSFPTGPEEGMPFCFYLHKGLAGGDEWTLVLSVHAIGQEAGSTSVYWWRKDVRGPVVSEDQVYHVVATATSAGTMRLRTGVQNRNGGFDYTDHTDGDLSSAHPDHKDLTLAKSWCPIQLFDCPQGFVETAATPTSMNTGRGSTTNVRPGLSYNVTTWSDPVNYAYVVRRFEGCVEDIAIWEGDKLAASTSALDRKVRLDPATAGPTLVSLWSGDEPGAKILRESTGRGSDIHLAPSGPTLVEGTSAAPDGAWWFNGQTSFAQCDLGDDEAALGNNSKSAGNPNYVRSLRSTAMTPDGAWPRLLEQGREWGVEVTFWPGSIEPNFEQVLMEIVDVLRVSILPTGRIGIRYAVKPDGTTNTVLHWYNDDPLISQTVLVPGERYTVTVFHSKSGHPDPNLRLYVNGKMDDAWDLATAFGREDYTLHGYGGILWGMGSVELLHYNQAAPNSVPQYGPTRSINLDHRSGFVGLIESSRIVSGIPIAYENYRYDPPASDAINMEQLWGLYDDSGTRDKIIPHRMTHPAINSGRGEPVWNPEDFSHPDYSRISQLEGLTVASDQQLYQEQHDCSQLDAANKPIREVLPIRSVRLIQLTGDNAGAPDALNEISSYDLAIGMAGDAFGGQLARDAESPRTGFRLLHTLAKWTFNRSDRADEATYPGFYLFGWETRSIYNGTTTTIGDHLYRAIHLQLSTVDDEHLVLGPILKGCLESDIRREFYDFGAGTNRPGAALPGIDAEGNTNQKPYAVVSPQELQPSWDYGLVLPHPRQNPITMIADWQVPAVGERFRMIAAARWAAWLKPVWRPGSPFRGEGTQARALWFFGQRGEFAEFAQTTAQVANQNWGLTSGAAPYRTVSIDVWLQPTRLDGTRVIAYKGGGPGNTNYVLYSQDGQICVAGTDGTTSWRYESATQVLSPIGSVPVDIPRVALKLREWNHVHVRMGPQSTGTAGTGVVSIWVNGQLVETVSTRDAVTTPFDPPTSTVSDNELFLGGVPLALRRQTWDWLSGTFSDDYVFDAWHGLMTEFRQTAAEDSDFDYDLSGAGAAAATGRTPQTRYTTSGDTYFLLHLNEGEFWDLENEALATSSGHACIDEIIPIRTDLDYSAGEPYRWVVFRDRLYFTNGRSRPQEVKFMGFADSGEPFRCHDAGILAPVVHRNALGTDPFGPGIIGTHPPTEPSGGGSSNRSDGLYSVWLSFVDDDGRESDPTQIYQFLLSSGVANVDEIIMRNIPRSTHPRVVARNVYISPDGGGTPLLLDQIRDNVGRIYELNTEPPTAAPAVRPDEQLPMPRARHIDVMRGSIMVADLTDELNGSNAFDFSSTEDPVYFSSRTTTVIDSADGRPVLGIRSHLGRTFLSKRDSLWAFAFAGITDTGEAETYVTLVNRSVGVGAGAALFDDVIFGANDRGIYAFNGGDTRYVSGPLEGEWSDIDRSDAGLRAMWGAYYRPDSQFMISARRTGEDFADRIYVLQPDDPTSWSILVVPEHSYLTTFVDEYTQEPQLMMGTASGHLLVYRPELDSDVTAAWSYDNQTAVLLDTVATVSTDSRTVTVTGPLDTLRDGLAGVKVKFSTSGEERTVLSNTATSMTFTEALQTTLAGDTVTIGGFKAYWSSAWREPQSYGKGLRAQWIDIDFVPTATADVVVRWIAAQGNEPAVRLFAEGQASSAQVDAQQGYLSVPCPVEDRSHGRYFRVWVGTEGTGKPFVLSGYGFRYMETGIFGGP